MLNKSTFLMVVGMLGCGPSTSSVASQAETPASADVDVDELDGVEPLRAMFNADSDKLRVIALLEPR